MSLNKIPITITFIASLCSIIGALFNIWTFNIPALLVSFAFLFGFAIIKYRLYYFNRYFIPAFFVIFVLHIIRGNGFAILSNGGYVLLFTTVFAACFETHGGIDIVDILRGITYLYKFYMVSLFAEFILVLLGFQSNLISLFNSTAMPGYKGYNGADFLHLLGFADLGGLNSILLGSQIAGMLSLFSVIWFTMLVRGLPNYTISRYGSVWIYISAFLYLITANLTGAILAVLAYLIYTVSRQKKVNLFKFIIPLIIVIGLAFLIDYSGVFHRIFNDNLVINHMGKIEDVEASGIDIKAISGMSTTEYYFYIHALPINNWLNLELINKLFGVSKESILSETVYRTGDFALAEILYTSGFIWLMVFLFAVFYTCLPALKFYKIACDTDEAMQQWPVLCASNALISVLFLVSLIHYSPATANEGALTLFSLHLAVTIYSRYRCGDSVSAFDKPILVN